VVLMLDCVRLRLTGLNAEKSTFRAPPNPEKDFNDVIAINLTAVWLSIKYEFRQMASQGSGGAIVNMSGTLGLIGAANIAP